MTTQQQFVDMIGTFSAQVNSFFYDADACVLISSLQSVASHIITAVW